MHFCFTVLQKNCMYSVLQPAGKIVLYLISKYLYLKTRVKKIMLRNFSYCLKGHSEMNK